MSILNLNISKNDTICGCEGAITVYAVGGTPPYSYSIDGGVTYSDFPIFTNLCSGLYTTKVSDISGETVTTNVNINSPTNPTLYIANLNTTYSILNNNGITITKQYNTSIDITPPLPLGVTVTLDVLHNNNFKTSPNSGSSSNITNSILYKNNIIIPNTTTESSTGTTINYESGCQGNPIYITSNQEGWESITINSGDNINIVTTTTLTQLEFLNCYVATSEESYSLVNLKLSGCGCCNIISG